MHVDTDTQRIANIILKNEEIDYLVFALEKALPLFVAGDHKEVIQKLYDSIIDISTPQ